MGPRSLASGGEGSIFVGSPPFLFDPETGPLRGEDFFAFGGSLIAAGLASLYSRCEEWRNLWGRKQLDALQGFVIRMEYAYSTTASE